MSDALRPAVLIPAYKPSPGLVDLVAALAERAFPAILIVDDGSGPEYRETFARAAAFPGVHLLRHAVNLGKGAALKTGINHALCAFPGLTGIVTADADGQHHPDDILRVASALEVQPGSLVLGARSFTGEVPLRSRFGNVLTRAIMHALMGQRLTDTQTGLRGIPAALLPRILRLESRGYELELEMLLAAHQLSVPIVEEPIKTIYEPGNKSSHFNPIVDSMKIYFVLLRFGSVSFLTAVLDNLVFYFVYRASQHILLSQVIGRTFAVAFNYTTVRSSVFYSRQRHKAVLPRYLALVVVSGSASYGGIRLLVARTGIGAVPAKLIVETLLFFVNFAVQRLFIFGPERNGNHAAALADSRLAQPDTALSAPAAPTPEGRLADSRLAQPDAALSAPAAPIPEGRLAESTAGVSTPEPSAAQAGHTASAAPAANASLDESNPEPAARPAEPRPPSVRLIVWAAALVLAVVLGVETYGFLTGRLFSQIIWDPIGIARFTRFGGMYLAIAAPLLLIVPWTFAALACAAVLVLTAVALGPVAVLAAAFFLVSCCALGSKLMGRGRRETLETDLLATLLGAGVYIFAMTLLARLPVHYPAVWTLVLAVPILADWRAALRRVVRWAGIAAGEGLRLRWERAGFALLVFVLLGHWVVVLKPEYGADALAMHLAIPADIAANHFLTYQPARFIWAVMPMGADWTYSIAYLLGGEYAARLLNFSMLLVLVALLYGAVRRWAPRSAAFLLAALFAATPVVQLVTGSLFVENLLAALVLGTMVAIFRLGETGEKRFLYAAAALAGSTLAVKFGGLAFAALALPCLIFEARRRAKASAAACVLAAALFLAAAVPTYVIAWQKTGNPVFPFLNQKIHSPLLDRSEDITDTRFAEPLNWRTPYNLTFHTTRYYEGQDGSFGFQYLALAALAVIAIFARRRFAVGVAAAIALLACTLILRLQPNARYLYPELPLLSIPFAALLGWSLAHWRPLYRVLIAFAVLATALDAYFLPASGFYNKDFGMKSPFSRAERNRYLERAAPIRKVIAYFDRAHPHAAVMVTDGSDIAGLTGDVYDNHWHQFTVYRQIRRAANVPELRKLLESWQVRYFIARKPAPDEYIDPPQLRQLVEYCTAAEYESGPWYLARLEPGCRPIPGEHPAVPTVTLSPGEYDDPDPALAFRGQWIHSDKFSGPANHTISYSDTPGAEASLAFNGRSLTWIYTKANNRGLAAVAIDGAPKGTVDLYSPTIQWQSRSTFGGLTAGRHIATIKVLGRNRPGALGQYVDVDGFVVK